LEKKILSEGPDYDSQLLKKWCFLYKDFHLKLFSAPNLDISVCLIDTLHSQCEKYFLSSLLRHEISLKDISGHHIDLKNAVLTRDAEKAFLILSNHVEIIYKNLENFVYPISLN
jgi:DNA-binding FadR family transcriptional regulator